MHPVNLDDAWVLISSIPMRRRRFESMSNSLLIALCRKTVPNLAFHWAAVSGRRSGLPVPRPLGDLPCSTCQKWPFDMQKRCHREGRKRKK